jgi:hypothetical protein
MDFRSHVILHDDASSLADPLFASFMEIMEIEGRERRKIVSEKLKNFVKTIGR